MKKKLSILFLLILLVGSPVLGLYRYFYGKSEYDLSLSLHYGKSIREELQKLQKGKLFWKYLAYVHEGGRKIKAGYYEIHGNYSIEEILQLLEEGKGKVQEVRILEGSSLRQTLEQLENAGIGTVKGYEEALEKMDFVYPTPNGNWEGYFYPNTYRFPLEVEEEAVIRVFLEEFLKHFPVEKYPNKEEFYQKLILASLLEKEAQLDEEKPLMASVIENRIQKGMHLGIDSTVNYLFDYKKKRIYYKDLEVDSPYNTYKVFGLPPAPICSPREASVEAAYHPAETDYYFFVASGEGRHHFSKSYQEHLRVQRNQKKKK